MKKEPVGIFQAYEKEPVIKRIAELIRKHSSRSAAARAWGVNVNTLNSYFKNESPPPMPRENLLQRIAESEGVSLDWLKNGEGEEPKIPNSGILRDSLFDMLQFLTTEERQQLTTILARKGVETVLLLLDDKNLELMQLAPEHKERVLRLASQLKEGASIDSAEDELTDPTRQRASRA